MSLISAYLRDTVTHNMANGNDQWGTPAAPTVVATRRAMITHGLRRMTNKNGDQVVATAHLKLDPGVTVTFGDSFEFDGDTHNVIEITKPRDFDVRFQVVWVE